MILREGFISAFFKVSPECIDSPFCFLRPFKASKPRLKRPKSAPQNASNLPFSASVFTRNRLKFLAKSPCDRTFASH